MDNIMLQVTYTGANGAAEKFVRELIESGVRAEILAQDGCIRYEYFLPAEGGDTAMLLERWRDIDALRAHAATDVMKKIGAAAEKYGVSTAIEKCKPL